MNQCKPCITIRNILTILKNNLIDFYKNTKRDIQSYSTINATVCELGKPYTPNDELRETLYNGIKNPQSKEAFELVKRIKTQARKNYNPEAWDKIEAK